MSSISVQTLDQVAVNRLVKTLTVFNRDAEQLVNLQPSDMDSQLATLFYVGIIVPTIITILVFVGFLVCLYKCNLSRKSSQTERVLPRTPSMSGSCRSRKSNKQDKFESISQHSNDSAIDMREIDANLESAEKGKTSEVVLDVLKLGKNYHSYQNEVSITLGYTF